MRLKSRLLLILLPSLLGVAALGSLRAWQSHQTVRSLVTLQGHDARARHAGQVVHLVQIERGLSSGFLGSKGVAFRAELDAARRATDAVAQGAVPELLGLRAEVSGLQLTPLASFARHTALIERLLAEQGQLALLATDTEVMRLATTLDFISTAKEFAGRERATLNGAAALGRLDTEPFARLVGVVAAQEQYLARFEASAGPALKAALAREQQDPRTTQALALRARALAAGPGGALDVPAAEWFKAATARIERLRVVELAVGAELDAVEAAHLADARRARAVSLAVMLAVVGLALALGLWQAREILRQLGGEPAYAVSVVRRIAEGDLSQRLEVRAGDRDSLLAEVAVMQQRVGALIARLHQAAGQVKQASGEIAAAMDDLAGRTTRSAASIEQASSTMKQLAEGVHDTGQTVRQGLERSSSSAEATSRSGHIINQLRATVLEVDQAVGQVRELVSSIDEVAFQTNLLALNAAVEASRAGAEGRGFDVVAAEVRELAGRTNQLAKRISELMSRSTERIQSGVAQAAVADEALAQVARSTEQVDALFKDVSTACGEERIGLDALTATLEGLKTGAAENAAAVEESTASTRSLDSLVADLTALLVDFKLAGPQATPPVVAAPARVAPKVMVTGLRRAQAH